MSPFALVVLAAGGSRRFGRMKQLEPLGPAGESLIDLTVHDAVRAGFAQVVFVVQPDMEGVFRARFAPRFGVTTCLDFAHQQAPERPGRGKPWGTAHAVLAAEPYVCGPFAVVNADDYYGPSGFEAIHQHFSSGAGDAILVGYEAARTLPPSGGVSRAVVEIDHGHHLASVREVIEVHREATGIVGVCDGLERSIPDAAIVSMNLWGFSPDIFSLLRRQFQLFLGRHRTDPEVEFSISTVVDDLRRTGAVRVRVVTSSDRWFGVTHPEDTEWVAEQVRTVIDSGRYPKGLLDRQV